MTITCFNQQLQDQVVQQLINETHEFECQYSTQEMHTMTKVVQTFHDNIKCGPKYMNVLAVINRSSVRKCEANKYPKCSETLLEACITAIASIDDTKWICSTYQSN